MQTFRTFILLAIVSIFFMGRPLKGEKTQVGWISLEQAAELMKKEKRPILIDLYTDWCGWCKVMDRKTYSNKQVVDYLSQKFYTVKINAETKMPLSWNGQVFQFNQRYKTNDFAIFLTGGQLSYPTTIFLTPDGAAPQAIPGYMEPRELELIVRYFGDGLYGRVPFMEFKSGFKPSW